MKFTILTVAFLLGFAALSAQMAIGKNSVDGDAILDFEENLNLGIILPRVITPDTNVVDGTIIYNTESFKIEVKKPDGWYDLSQKAKLIDPATSALPFDPTEDGYDRLKEMQSTNGVILGENSFEKTGVLVLESKNKALVLPKMADPAANIVNPEAGTMAYDTESQSLCVFNGLEWTFWGK